jgi:hypothetical protein
LKVHAPLVKATTIARATIAPRGSCRFGHFMLSISVYPSNISTGVQSTHHLW